MECTEYLVFISSVILAASIISMFVKYSKKKDPAGTLYIRTSNDPAPPGSRASRNFIVIGFGAGMINLMATIALCALGVYDDLPTWIVIQVPTLVRFISYSLIVAYYCWGILVIRYNVNYTPCWRRMPQEYRIATGGPYALVKHPMYVAKGIFPVIMFFATGFVPFLFGLVSWLGIPHQAKMEEELLRNSGNREYEDYARSTGRFFPKLK
jgi:protein-S-isoprenylcysteine O-methyltransferase Ste14